MLYIIKKYFKTEFFMTVLLRKKTPFLYIGGHQVPVIKYKEIT
jgi:hypothetical protein